MKRVYSVSQITKYVKKTLDSDTLLAGLFVQGEVYDFTAHSSGHLYFKLKDDAASLNAVMFRGDAENLGFNPNNGMKIVAFGKIALYERTGQVQIIVEHMEAKGIGDLALAYRERLEKLKSEGLFENKKSIPRFCKAIAVITSPTGAAIEDICRTIRDRNNAIKIVLVPSLVQGEGAADALAQAVRDVNEWGGADCIIIGRGGGSMEDLWAFNEEILARAIAASEIPIISAVGHETDFTISDFVADVRAQTPTAAAQLAAYSADQVMTYLYDALNHLDGMMSQKLASARTSISACLTDIDNTTRQKIRDMCQDLAYMQNVLQKLSPYEVFKRGYAVATDSKKQAIMSVQAVNVGDKICIFIGDGEIHATIDQKIRVVMNEKY